MRHIYTGIAEESVHGIYIEDIQMFGVNMTFISSREVKKCIFHDKARMKYTFFHFMR